jgi:hypothetical protein
MPTYGKSVAEVVKEMMEITQCKPSRKITNSKSFPVMVASLFPRNQINQKELESARI